MTDSGTRGLSQQDAFFVAYQEASAVAMQLGGAVEFSGGLRPGALEAIVARLVPRWVWHGGGPVDTAGMLPAGPDGPSLESWRNTAIDPFHESPQLRWIRTLTLRAHHAANDDKSLLLIADFVLRALASGDSQEPRQAAAAAPKNLSRHWCDLGYNPSAMTNRISPRRIAWISLLFSGGRSSPKLSSGLALESPIQILDASTSSGIIGHVRLLTGHARRRERRRSRLLPPPMSIPQSGTEGLARVSSSLHPKTVLWLSSFTSYHTDKLKRLCLRTNSACSLIC